MKKCLAVLISIALMFVVLPINTLNASALTEGYYTYKIINGEATITGCDKSISGNITIPSTLDGYPVTRIDNRAFHSCSSLTNITIPGSITWMSEDVFAFCYNLTTVIIHDGFKVISPGAFWGCSNLTSITIPYSVTNISIAAFDGCSSLKTVYYCGTKEQWNNVRGKEYNQNLTSATIYYHNFGDWQTRTEPTVCKDGEQFRVCSICGLEEVVLIEAEQEHSFKMGVCTVCNVISEDEINYTIENNGATISLSESSISGDVVIPSTVDGYPVTGIGEWAFNNCDAITSITIPASVTSIGFWAFYGCSSLTSINVNSNNSYFTSLNGVLFNKDKTTILCYPSGKTATSYVIPSSVTSIGDMAFIDCMSLNSITIPNGVTRIGGYAFVNCKFTSIVLPESVEIIDACAFTACTLLTSITIPNSVTSIGWGAFDSCKSIETIIMSNNIKSIEEDAFSGCNSLKTVYYCGTEKEWNNISIGSNNAKLINATRYYHKYDNTCDKECNICGFVRSITHTYDNACDTSCNICGDTRTIEHTYDNDCDSECNVCGETRTVKPHEYANSCDTSCNICGFIRSITHIYDNACDSCCNVCGNVRAIEHTYDNTCDKTCNVCGNTRTISHTYDNDCDHECNICGNIRTVNPHVYTNACDTSCNICNAIRTIEHTYDNACDKNCNICGNIRTIVHTYDNACDSECNICGNIRTVNSHEYTNTCDTTCNICGFIRSITHTNPKEWTIRTESTCSQKGEKYGACSVCGEEVTAEIEINTNNHNYINGRCEWCNSYIESKHDYDAEFDETWVVEKENTASITITFSKDTYVEENWDYIYIYDANNNLVGEYTGAALASESIKVNGNIVKIRLVTDRVQNYYGFKVTNIEFACAHNYSIETKTVSCTEDGYKKHTCCYCGNIYYTDQVKALGHKYFSIVTTPICIEGGWTTHTCENCGNTYTDNYIPATGFHIYENGNCTQCKGLLESDHNYENLTDKTWEIYRKGATSITLIFSAETIVEEKYDHIYIYDAANNEIGKYTGNELASRSVTALGDTIKIRLCTDRVGTAYGFKLTDISAEYISGDLNGDSEVDIRDLIRLKKILLGNAQSESASSDVDSSGETTANDLTFLRKLIIGILAKEVY